MTISKVLLMVNKAKTKQPQSRIPKNKLLSRTRAPSAGMNALLPIQLCSSTRLPTTVSR